MYDGSLDNELFSQCASRKCRVPVNPLRHHDDCIRFLTSQTKKPSETIKGKGENDGNQHFRLFPQ